MVYPVISILDDCILVRAKSMSNQKRKQLKLTKKQAEQYQQCLAQCTKCLLNGECEIQRKVKGIDNGSSN